MRVTGGVYRGRIAKCPPGEIRPTMDRMRESMFAILGNINNLSFLDLFSGSGIVALEALSRGASKALLVENDRRKRKILQENLQIAEQYPLTGRGYLRIQTVESFLRLPGERFDLVHFDPPFPMPNKYGLLEMASSAGQPNNGGTLMIHYPSEDNLPDKIASLRCYDRRKYGRSFLAFYTRDN